jgi:hypothetical protein
MRSGHARVLPLTLSDSTANLDIPPARVLIVRILTLLSKEVGVPHPLFFIPFFNDPPPP